MPEGELTDDRGPRDSEDPLLELASIARDLRAYLQWQGEQGATGVPRDPDLAEKLRQNPLPSWNSPGAFSPRSSDPRAADRDQSVAYAHSSQNSSLLSFSSSPTPSELPASAGEGSASLGEGSGHAAAALRPGGPAPAEESTSFAAPQLDAAPRKRTSLVAPASLPQAPLVDRAAIQGLGDTLDEVAARVRSCTQCELHQARTQTVFSRGTGSSGLCFVGEGPGADEDAQGEPFVGAAGQLLDKMIAAMGFHRDEVYVCNVVKCRPPNNRRPTPVEMQTCSPYLRRQLELLNPRVIVALGGTAVTGLLGLADGITRVRGRFRLYDGRIAVMPTFHPAYLLRNPSAKREVWTDLRQVLKHMGRDLPTKD